MNKVKRVGLAIRHKFLRLSRIYGKNRYNKKAYKYFKDCGIDFDGRPKYINYDVDFDLIAPEKIHIGENTVIAKQTLILVHDYSIQCGLEAIGQHNKEYEVQFLKDVYIGKNSFVGARCIILPGTKIGNNCIVGAGSVVSGEIPDNSVIAGNPARFICKTAEWAWKKLEKNEFVYGAKNGERR